MDKITRSISINAPIAKVWDALTNPAVIKIYLFGTELTTDWKEGSQIIFKGNWHGTPYTDKGKVLSFEKNRLLRYSYWSSVLGLPDKEENHTITTYALTEEKGKTLLTASQDNLGSQPKEVQEHAQAYWEGMLKSIKDLLEK